MASWKLWRVPRLLPLTRIRQTQEYEGWAGALEVRGIEGKGRLGWVSSSAQEPHQLVFCSKCSAGQGEEGGPRRHMLGAQLLRGQWLQAVRGRGGAAPGGRGTRLQPCRPQRPEMARGWVGEQVGPGKLKGRRLSCGLRMRARSQCGCSLSAPARRRGEGAGSLVSGEQDGRASALERGVQPPPLPRRRKPQPRPWGLRGKTVHPQTHPCPAPER